MERKKYLLPFFLVGFIFAQDDLDLDAMWDNTVWNEIEDIADEDIQEVDNITAVAGVRGAEAEDEADKKTSDKSTVAAAKAADKEEVDNYKGPIKRAGVDVQAHNSTAEVEDSGAGGLAGAGKQDGDGQDVQDGQVHGDIGLADATLSTNENKTQVSGVNQFLKRIRHLEKQSQK